MQSSSYWTVRKEGSGFLLSRQRSSALAETVNLSISSSAAPEWQAAISRILQRIRAGRFHSLPLTLGLRCMLGCWRGVHDIRCFGGLPRHSCHVVGVGDSLFLLIDLYNWAAYPISRHELETI